MDLTEDELLAAIGRVLSGAGPEVVVGPGDDAAVVRAGSGGARRSRPTMVEGVHFRSDLTTPRDLGYKAIAVNVSDIAAMAGSPRFALCALTLTNANRRRLGRGARRRHARASRGVRPVAGGRQPLAREGLDRSRPATGEVAPGRAVRRSGAEPGDHVVVTGSLGGSAAGLRVAWQRSWSDDERDALRLSMRPVPRVGEAAILAAHGVTSMWTSPTASRSTSPGSAGRAGPASGWRRHASRCIRRPRRRKRSGEGRTRVARHLAGHGSGGGGDVGAPGGVRGVAQRHRRHHRRPRYERERGSTRGG